MRRKQHSSHVRGFALIESLLALLIMSIGLVGIAKLQSLALTGAGESRARSEAVTIAQQELETLRNLVTQTQFNDMATGSDSVQGSTASFTVTRTVSTPQSSYAYRRVVVTVTWEDRLTGDDQSISVDGQIAWQDPLSIANLSQDELSSELTATGPTGEAIRSGYNPDTGDYFQYTPDTGDGQGDVVTEHSADGTSSVVVGSDTTLYTANTTLLLDADGNVILILNADSSGNAQDYTVLSGTVYLDKTINNMPNMADIDVRLSSEGACFYNNSSDLGEVTAQGNGNNTTVVYEYFTYTCYVGPGWYGNVGVTIDGNASANICVGDPTASNTNTSTSLHPQESNVRVYRGFWLSGSTYLSAGVAAARTYPSDGNPGNKDGDFLVTKLTGQKSCTTEMLHATTSPFIGSAGKNLCISPDEFSGQTDQCPSIWPGFEGEIAGITTYTVSTTVTGSGTVSSSPAGISCTSSSGVCSYNFAAGTVTLTASPTTGYYLSSWGGACAGSTSTCTLIVNGNTSVTATFTQNAASTYTATVTKSGTGSGTVSSVPAGIDCGSTCSFDFTANAEVTLTATADAGSSFTGWSGACSGTSPSCTLTMSSAQTAVATFSSNSVVTYTLDVSKSGSGNGSIASSPAGIDCGSTCSYAFTENQSVTLTATASAGSSFGGWGGSCSAAGNSTVCTVTMNAAKSATATFTLQSCTTTYSGSAIDKFGSMTASPVGSCSMQNGTANYSCTITTTYGTSVTLRNYRTTGSASAQYDCSKVITADCTSHTGYNFSLSGGTCQ